MGNELGSLVASGSNIVVSKWYTATAADFAAGWDEENTRGVVALWTPEVGDLLFDYVPLFRTAFVPAAGPPTEGVPLVSAAIFDTGSIVSFGSTNFDPTAEVSDSGDFLYPAFAAGAGSASTRDQGKTWPNLITVALPVVVYYFDPNGAPTDGSLDVAFVVARTAS